MEKNKNNSSMCVKIFLIYFLQICIWGIFCNNATLPPPGVTGNNATLPPCGVTG